MSSAGSTNASTSEVSCPTRLPRTSCAPTASSGEARRLGVVGHTLPGVEAHVRPGDPAGQPVDPREELEVDHLEVLQPQARGFAFQLLDPERRLHRYRVGLLDDERDVV